MLEVPVPLAEVLRDRYHLERELGSGGMATVYLAADQKHHRKVAVKVLHPELAAVLGAERFLHEIDIAARLDHPHILRLHDSGEAGGGFLFYVMPSVEGESLRDRLSRGKQLPLEDALQIARELADALAYAHRQNIVHRDIKPENIMLSGGHARVADFGIARATGSASATNLTQTGMSVGTPTYMSSEQAGGSSEVDGRSDLYSLACVLYEMLAGRPPFTGPTLELVRYQHLTVEAPPITNLRPAMPAPVAAALARGLAKTPADRYSPVGQFSEALRPIVFAPGPAATTAPRRSSRRVPMYVGMIAVALLAGLGIARLLSFGPWGTLVSKGKIANRERVILADFENCTADSTADATVTELIRVGISRSQVVSLVDPGQVGRILEMMARDPSKGVIGSIALEAAERDGIRAVITGEVSAVGNRFSLKPAGSRDHRLAQGAPGLLAGSPSRQRGRSGAGHSADQ